MSSGNLTVCYGKSPFSSWENPLFLWPFSIAMLVYQTVYNPIYFSDFCLRLAVFWDPQSMQRKFSQVEPLG